MSTTDLEPGRVSNVVFAIVNRAKEKKSLSSLTPRLVRQEAEDELKVTRNTLDAQKYKDVVKRAIKNAMNPEANARRGKKAGKNGPVPKAGESTRRSSLSKFAKSKEIISDSESAAEPPPSTSRRKAKVDKSADADEERKPLVVSSISKVKSSSSPSKSVSGVVGKRSSPDSKSAQSAPKRKRPSKPIIVQSDSDAEIEVSDLKPKVASSSHRIPDKQESDSDVSSLIDEPVKKRRGKPASSDNGKTKTKATHVRKPAQPLSEEDTVKELKSLVKACGVHKKWVLELKDLDVNAQITHIRKILRDLGMKGNKMSISQAENIRNRRELADELDDVQRFGKAIVSGKPFQSKSPTKKGGEEDDDDSDEESGSYSDREQPVVNNARKSIMAFLADQSSDDD